MLSSAEIRRRFVDVATDKFVSNVPDFARLRDMVAARGGTLRNDHAAIRSADPRVTKLVVRAAAVMGMVPERTYSFPSKKLESFDLQVPGTDHQQFKIFVSEVDYAAFPDDVAEAMRGDVQSTWASADHAPLTDLLEQAEHAGGLDAAAADAFVDHVAHRLLTRAGGPMRRAVLDAVSAVSGEAASALALGADFNHVTIDVLAAGYRDIDAMVDEMREQGFRMLPAIQGAPGTKLRQTATMAATMDTPVLEPDGTVGLAQTERQFVEIIQRGPFADDAGDAVTDDAGQPLIYKHFLAANAEKIFDAASTRARAS